MASINHLTFWPQFGHLDHGDNTLQAMQLKLGKGIKAFWNVLGVEKLLTFHKGICMSFYVITITMHFKLKVWAFKDSLLPVLKISNIIKYLIMKIYLIHDNWRKNIFLPFAFSRI